MSSDFERAQEWVDSMNWDGLSDEDKANLWADYEHEDLIEELEREECDTDEW